MRPSSASRPGSSTSGSSTPATTWAFVTTRSGAATNPDPEIFAYAAATVKACMDVTHRLGGENYVMWGGREGYETLINTNIGHEL